MKTKTELVNYGEKWQAPGGHIHKVIKVFYRHGERRCKIMSWKTGRVRYESPEYIASNWTLIANPQSPASAEKEPSNV